MTLHVILGAGEMPARELTATLDDLWKKDLEKDAPHWYLIQAKAEPNATDKAMMTWMHKNDIWYEVISDGDDVDKLYTESQKTHKSKRLAPTVVKLMNDLPEGEEGTQLLALFASEDFSAEDDRWLNDVGSAVQEAGFKVLALNDGLVEIDMLDEDGAAAVAEAAPAKSKTKSKTAEAATEALEQYTRDQLGEMDLSMLKGVAAQRNISLPPRTRRETYIDHILGDVGPEVEIETEGEVEGVEEPEETPVTKQYAEAQTGTMTGNVTLSAVQLSAPAMLIVIANGTVVSRVITTEEAQSLIS